MDAEILAERLAATEACVLRLDQRLDAIEGALTSTAENSSNYLTQESIPAILDAIRSEQAVLLEQARAQESIADAEARVAEAEAAEAEAEETVAILEAEQLAALDEEPMEPEVEIIEEEPSPEPEGSSTPKPKKNDMNQLGFR